MLLEAGFAAATAVAAYLNGLYGDWLDDDPLAIVDNPDVQGLRELRAIWCGTANAAQPICIAFDLCASCKGRTTSGAHRWRMRGATCPSDR